MASKGPRSKLDHETRARRQKALEAPREPPRPKLHWDYVLEEMLWLSKEFDSERKWKLSMAKKIAQRANKTIADHATKGERKQKEEEHRMRKVALNISKDVKKFWIKIEKLVVYKHQLEFEEKKKKALDKQLDFLIGQTERYSTMLAENLVDMPYPQKQENRILQTNESPRTEVPEENIDASNPGASHIEGVPEAPQQEAGPLLASLVHPDDLDNMEADDDYESSLNEESEDDERTIDEDEALITEAERNEELAALEAEANLPLDDILKMYAKVTKVSRESSPDNKGINSNLDSKNLIIDTSNQANGCDHEASHSSSDEDDSSEEGDDGHSYAEFVKKNHGKSNGNISSRDEQEDKDYVASDEGKDDETTLSEEEELAKKEDPDHLDERKLVAMGILFGQQYTQEGAGLSHHPRSLVAVASQERLRVQWSFPKSLNHLNHGWR